VKALRAVAVLAGVGVAGWLVWEIGPATLAADLRALSWRLAVLLLPQAAVTLIDAAGWRYAFPGRLPDLGPLVGIRLAGEAVNDTTPTGTLGGDALKALLVARATPGVSVEDGLVAAVVAKTALVGTQAVFILVALGLAGGALVASPAVLGLLGLLAAFTVTATAAFLWAQLRGLFRIGGRALVWLGLGERAMSAAGRMDRTLRTLYRERRGRLAATWGLHLAGWTAGVAETWLALRFLGSPVPLVTALVIEAGAIGARAVGFLVPASIGVQEGGVVGLFVLLGLEPATGLAFGTVRRIREVSYILLGYASLALGPGPRVAAPEPGA
jgi:uncharacterized protein (TIRG00374 family)